MNSLEKVMENRLIGDPSQKIYKLILRGQIAREALPGQFVHIQISRTQDPLLRRPLSIGGIDRQKDEITIYYRIEGAGTNLLAQIPTEETLSVMGPLGSHFTLPNEGTLLLVAGGIGVFPLYTLLEAAPPSLQVQLLFGGENKTFLESADLVRIQQKGGDVAVATLDGSLGRKGLVTDLLVTALTCRDPEQNAFPLRVATCGPKGMLKAVTEICLAQNVPVEVSLEERMACGVGACLGCVCTVKTEEGELRRKRVCKEGPVLDGKEVVWDGRI